MTQKASSAQGCQDGSFGETRNHLMDARHYLQSFGERVLREPPGDSPFPYDARLVAAAAALVAVEAVPADLARAIVSQYTLAPARTAEETGAAAPGIGRWRVAPSGHVIESAWGSLAIAYVVMSDHATMLRVTMRPDRGALASASLPGAQGLPWQLALADDQGATSTAEFNGSRRHGQQEWDGEFTARAALAPDTAWIDVLGERVPLTGRPVAAAAWVEPFDEDDPAVRHLWERAATRNDFHDPLAAFEAAAQALVAVGALRAGDPAIRHARAAAAILDARRSSSAPDAARAGAAVSRETAVPPSWRSLLARWGRAEGPAGTVVVGTVTPPFDGITVAVTALDSRPGSFTAGVEIVPDARTGLPYDQFDERPRLTWWAVDDHGHYSLAEPGGWDFSGAQGRGTLIFRPGLDPGAAWIDLVPTAVSSRAVIRVPLPWGGHGSALGR
jgi:hypothetical protein